MKGAGMTFASHPSEFVVMRSIWLPNRHRHPVMGLERAHPVCCQSYLSSLAPRSPSHLPPPPCQRSFQDLGRRRVLGPRGHMLVREFGIDGVERRGETEGLGGGEEAESRRRQKQGRKKSKMSALKVIPAGRADK